MSDRINFARGVPAEAAFPRAQIALCASALAGTKDATAFQYGPALGPLPFRAWLAEYHGLPVAQVMAGDGSVGLFDILCRLWLEPGQTVLVEQPTYDRVLELLRRHRANIVPLPMEADGPCLDALDAAVRSSPRFLYTVPDFQNPSGIVWSTEKRRAAAKAARRHGFTIVEDSPYRLLRYEGEPRPSFLDLAADVTVHLSSFSKVIVPGLRAAYMVAAADTVAAAGKVAEATYVTPGNFALSLAAEWLSRGHLDGQIQRLKHLYAPRRQAMLAALAEFMPAHAHVRPEGGFFVGVTLARPIDAAQLHEHAAARGVDLAQGAGFFTAPPATPFLRLPFGSTDEAGIRRGIRLLSECIGRCEHQDGPARG